jgi:hypothetical protein
MPLLLINLWRANVAECALRLSELVVGLAAYLITLLRQQSDFFLRHPQIYSTPNAKCPFLYGCGKDSFHLTSIPNILANWRLGLVDRFMWSF